MNVIQLSPGTQIDQWIYCLVKDSVTVNNISLA